MDDLAGCITRAELCDLLRISAKTSRRMDRDGTGPKTIRLSPRLIRYPISEVADFMRTHGLDVPAEIAGSIHA